MSFWDNVKKFTQPYSDEEYDDYEDEDLDDFEEETEEAPASRSSRRSSSYSASSDTEDFGLDFGTAPAASASSAPSSSFSGQVLNMNSNKQEVVLFHAKAFDDAAKAADELRNKKAVVLNMENVDKALTRRVVDFLSGCVYSLDGKVKKIAQSTYLFCPHTMDIVGDFENSQSEVESYV